MLNSTEHGISTAHKNLNAKKKESFLAFLLSDVVFIMFINVILPTSRVKHSTTELPTRVVLLCPCSYRYLEKWPSTHFWGSSFEPCYIENNAMLTHLRRMEFPTIIYWTGPFPGLLGGIFIFIQILKEHSVSKQWRPRMWRLIWVCTVCVCPTKRKLGLYGLSLRSVNQIEQPLRWKYCRIINTWMMFRYAVTDLTLCISSGLLAISVLKP